MSLPELFTAAVVVIVPVAVVAEPVLENEVRMVDGVWGNV